MKKIALLVIIGCLLLSGVGTSAVVHYNALPKTYSDISPVGTTYEDDLDQSQETWVENAFMPVGTIPITNVTLNVQVAQSFIPQKEVLTRVELYIGKNTTTTYPYVVGIRDTLAGSNLAETSVNAADIVTQNFSWVEFDFPDIWVTVGQTYYIVCTTQNSSNNWYLWGANNDSTSYLYGCAWVSLDGNNWSNQSAALQSYPHNPYTPIAANDTTWDMCFRTYGLEETFLEVTSVPGMFPTFTIKNIGNVTAWDVEISLAIQGGILGRINKTITATVERLEVDQEVIVTLSLGTVFGFGPISMTLKVHGANVRELSTTANGIIIIFFIIIR